MGLFDGVRRAQTNIDGQSCPKNLMRARQIQQNALWDASDGLLRNFDAALYTLFPSHFSRVQNIEDAIGVIQGIIAKCFVLVSVGDDK